MGAQEVRLTSGHGPRTGAAVEADGEWKLSMLQALRFETFGLSVREKAWPELRERLGAALAERAPQVTFTRAEAAPEL